MDRCEFFRELLLEADPDELEAGRGTPLGDHLATCPFCRLDAERILAGQDALGKALAAIRPVSAAPAAGARSRRRGRWLVIAAAAVIGLIWTGSSLKHGNENRPDGLRPGAHPTRPLVAAAANTVVFETDNPDITIVWFY